MAMNRDVGGRRDRHGHSLDEVEVACGECGKRARLVGGDVIYPHREDLARKLFYLCECKAYVGTHQGTRHPLGSPANARTRSARSDAHAVFDPLWKASEERNPGKGNARRRGYAWLAGQLGIRPEDCHIGMMDIATARKVREICLPYFRRLSGSDNRRENRQ